MTQAQTSFASLVEGHCWECGDQLERIAGWAECVPCGRRFKITGRQVIEQIAVLPHLADAIGLPAWIGGTVLNRDGTVERTSGDGMVVLTDQAEWIMCSFEVA